MKKRIILFIMGLILISIALIIYKNNNSYNSDNIYFAFYNGIEKLDTMPLKDNSNNLVFDYGECDNGASIAWNEEEWAPLVKNLSKSKTKCSLYFRSQNAVDYIKNLAKTDFINLIKDDTREENIRYVGLSPNNYIDIGDNSLWRIIGVMNNITNLDNNERKESLLKIIRADSIGNYSWDSSLETVNAGYGVNEWSDSDLMKLLNPKELYTDTPLLGGSLYWLNEKGSCYIDRYDASGDCDFTNSGLSDEAKKKIAKVRWNTGTIGEAYDTGKITAKYMYDAERSNHNGKEQCESTGGNGCNDTVPRTTTWDGYIALPYPSDYGYAVDKTVRTDCLLKSMYDWNNDICKDYDWLTQFNGQIWTITSEPYSTSSYNVFRIDTSIRDFSCRNAYGVMPAAYLKSTVKILPNPKPEQVYGTENNPFQLGFI